MIYDMGFYEACEEARKGHFVSNHYFGDDQSMHYYNGDLYYEDGVCLIGDTLEFVASQEWAQSGWYIKYPKDKVDSEKLEKLHKSSKNVDINYEEAIIK